MTATQNSSYEDSARQSLENDPHYLTKVIEMADRKKVVSSEDIFSARGVKLVSKNVVISSKLREDLLKHKLLKPIDQSLVIGDRVTPESLAREVALLINGDANLQRLAARSGDALAMHQAFAQVPLSSQIAFKLTVAKEQQPNLFHHLLLVALISNFLAVRVGLSEQDTIKVLSAALFHDLGELHTDPMLLNPEHRITEAERRYIYVHPITGYLIVREAAGVDIAVATAVLQHQERLDGSGYPYGLSGDKIGIFARIIGVADVCASIFARFGTNDRLSAFLRLNQLKYDPKLLALLHDGFTSQPNSAAVGGISVLPRLRAAAQLLEQWEEFRALMTSPNDGNPPDKLQFLIERMVSIRSMLVQFGFDPDSLESLVMLAAEEPDVANELDVALDELHWQFTELERETTRNRENILETLSTYENRFLDAWIENLRDYIRTS